MHYFFKDLLLYFWGWFRQTQKDGFGEVHIDSYCINRLYCSFPLPFLIFIIPPANEVVYSMMELLICKYEPFWQEVSLQSQILRWPLRTMDLLFNFLPAYASYTTSHFIFEFQGMKMCHIPWFVNQSSEDKPLAIERHLVNN